MYMAELRLAIGYKVFDSTIYVWDERSLIAQELRGWGWGEDRGDENFSSPWSLQSLNKHGGGLVCLASQSKEMINKERVVRSLEGIL